MKPTQDFQKARERMVKEQLIPRGISNRGS